MVDPTNPADVPELLRQPYPGHPKPPAYHREVARKVKNRRWLKVVNMAEIIGTVVQSEVLRSESMGDALHSMGDVWWKDVARAAGHPSRKPPSWETRQKVIDKVRQDLERERT